MPDDLLGRALYSYADVDRLVGLSAGTAHRWLEGYEQRGHRYLPVLRPRATGSATVTWGELVEAWLLAEFRRAVPVRRLRPAVVRLRDEFGSCPLVQAHPVLQVEGRELVRIVQDRDGGDRPMAIVVRNGQHVLAESADRSGSAVEHLDGVAVRLRPDPRTPAVVIDPQRALGQPAIRNVRTASLAEDARAGTDRKKLADLYSLTVDEVDQALRFESKSGGGPVKGPATGFPAVRGAVELDS
jgi:uncharacterized protein (DUF433 family)